MGIFDKKGSVSRQEMRTALRRTAVPHRKYTQKQGVAMEKEIFGSIGSKYGSQISKKDVRIGLEKMRRQRFGKSLAERKEIERKMDFLKKL